MPPRDEQEYEQRRQQIIDGALEAFAAKGFEGASNKDIAQAAGIASPGLIYHYFKDKLDLLHQLLLSRMPLLRLFDEAQALMDKPPEVALPALAERLLAVYREPLTLSIMRVVFSEALRNQRVAELVSEIGPGRGLRLLAQYLERQMEAGRLRRMDPQIAARSFVGPLIVYVATQELFRATHGKAIPADEMARNAAAIFLRGMAVEPNEGPPRDS